MRVHSIRHLPVVDSERVVGLVSLADLDLHHPPNDAATLKTAVDQVMATSIYVVAPEASASVVAQHMADEKLDAAVIVSPQGTPLGVFTVVDALRFLARELAHPTSDAEPADPAPEPGDQATLFEDRPIDDTLL